MGQRVSQGDLNGALAVARQQAAMALADLGAVLAIGGARDESANLLRQAFRLHAGDANVFHNTVTALQAAGRLKGEVLQKMLEMLITPNRPAWLEDYRDLLLLPRFLNLEFVSGKCNLKCRMCTGTNSPKHPNKLTFLPAAELEQMLAAAPSISGVTLSSGDSDPLLHPELEAVIEVARRHEIVMDFFTNGLALNERRIRLIVQAGVVGMFNFSIDAATPETYQRIRGGDWARVLANMEMFQAVKKELGLDKPMLSLSFVAMADNIAELPAFVDLALRLGAGRVFVEDLAGWDGQASENRLARENPRCMAYAAEAKRRAAAGQLALQLPEGLMTQGSGAQAKVLESTDVTVPFCTWLQGVWVDADGAMSPCCMMHGTKEVDMGNIHEGPLLANEKYVRFKSLLCAGKVLPGCHPHLMCKYVQNQKLRGIPLRVIQPGELAGADNLATDEHRS